MEDEAVQAVKTLRSMLITGHLIRFFPPEQTALAAKTHLFVQKMYDNDKALFNIDYYYFYYSSDLVWYFI